MKIGDIKVEALKLMFTNYGFDVGINDLQRMLNDENYASYIVNMNGAIARALDRIENACVLPLKRKVIRQEDCETGKSFLKFDTSKIKDLFMIDRITAEYENGQYDGNIGFNVEGEVVIFEKANASFTILYYPTIKTVDEKVLDSEELWIPDKISRIIPYFIKGDLYQEEEPDLAADARNIFEACLDDFKRINQSKQNYIYQTYRLS